MFNPRYGALGLFVFPAFVFIELLAPVIEAVGIIGLAVGLIIHAIDVPFAICFFLFAYGYGTLLSIFVLVMEEWSYHRYEQLRDQLLLLAWILLESVGYRQLTVLWRLQGLFGFLIGRSQWGRMERKGFQRKDPASLRPSKLEDPALRQS